MSSSKPSTADYDAGPVFKDQMRQSGGGGGGGHRREPDAPTTKDAPLASARLVSDTWLSDEERIELRQQNLELQLEVERQRVANLQQQQARPPVTPTSSLSKTQWIGLTIVATVLFLVLATVAGVCGTGYCSRGGGISASSPPLPTTTTPPAADDSTVTATAARAGPVLSHINGITLSGRTLTYPSSSSPEERSLKWLIEDDLNIAVDDIQKLRQRYALGTLWFLQTPTPFGTADHATTWTTNIGECQWHDVDCDDMGRVTVLDLSNVENVRGQIPNDLGLLTGLTRLLLSRNQLTGTIPSSLGVLTALTELQLWDNRLSGFIPSSLGALTALTYLGLSSNQLSGTIPSSLGALTKLNRLDLNINRLIGTIPWHTVGALTALTILWLQINQLSGTIASSLGTLTDLTELWLTDNKLSGTIPSSLGDLTALTSLYLHASQVSGTIPSSLGALTALTIMTMNLNNLSGTIPPSLGALTSMTSLWLYNNKLSGTIPSSFGALTVLTDLRLSGNLLNGTVPFCTLNYTFDFFAADCSTLNCTCCTGCCPAAFGNIPISEICS
jgi:Leucine-rich repeat (LRR) protein